MNQILFNNRPITPSKVVCIGRNYVEHIEELGNEVPENMVLFNKPNSAISEALYYFTDDTRFEGEICFLVENKQIAGIGLGLDLTKANIQNRLKQKGLPWERAKGFNGSAVLGKFVPFDGRLESLRMELWVNRTLVQFADYDLMIYKPHEMIAEIETFMSLEDGDVIMSGTPRGVGNYKPDDLFSGRIYSHDRVLVETSWVCQ